MDRKRHDILGVAERIGKKLISLRPYAVLVRKGNLLGILVFVHLGDGNPLVA